MSDQPNVSELSEDQLPQQPELPPLVASASDPVASIVQPQPAQLKRKPSLTQSWLLKTWWILGSFSLPFTTRYLSLGSRLPFDVDLCFRSGLVGLFAAVLIYVLWQFDKSIGKMGTGQTDNIARVFGVVLWLLWVGAGLVMLTATDEVTKAMGAPHP